MDRIKYFFTFVWALTMRHEIMYNNKINNINN